jgi:hypothetical protein
MDNTDVSKDLHPTPPLVLETPSLAATTAEDVAELVLSDAVVLRDTITCVDSILTPGTKRDFHSLDIVGILPLSINHINMFCFFFACRNSLGLPGLWGL